MAKQLQLRRGTTSQHSTFTGANGEVTIDTDKKVVVVHDGATAGGIPLAKQATVDTKVDKVTSTNNALPKFNGTTGALQNSNIINDANGNVGIGVTPSAWIGQAVLQVGSCGLSSGSSRYATVSNNTYSTSSGWAAKYINNGKATMFIQDYVDGSHSWYTTPSGTAGNAITWTTAMTLDSVSRLSIANGLVSGWNGSSYSATTNGIEDYKVSGSNFTGIYGRTTADTSLVFQAVVAGDTKAVIRADGSFGAKNSVYGGVSDSKLKENIVDANSKLEKLMKVQVRNFNFIGEKEKQIGVIAQEIEQIFPSLVYETKDTKRVEVEKKRLIPAVEEIKDNEGNILQEAIPESIEKYIDVETIETGEVTKNVKYSIIYMMMLKGMQEQQEIIQDLISRIEILESK